MADPAGELLELTQDAILVRDVRTSAITYWNRGAESMYGWPREEARGQISHQLLHTRFPVSREATEEALLVEGYWEGELSHIRRDGQAIIVSSRQAIQRDRSGEALAILEINTDITERKRADEERLQLAAEQRARELAELALDRLSRLQRVTALLSEALTPEGVAEVVVSQGVAALDAQAGRISILREHEPLLDIIGFSGYTRVTTPYSSNEALPTNEVLRTGQPLFVTTYAEVVARFPRDRELAEPVMHGAIASAPLVVEGRVFGAMTLTFNTDRQFAQEDRDLLVAMATHCALALERARLYERSLATQADLLRSRDQLAAILGGIAEGVTVQDSGGGLVYANSVAAAMSGYASPDDMTRKGQAGIERFRMLDEAGNVFPPDSLPGRRLLRGERAEEVLVQFEMPGTGDRRWSIVDATPIRDQEGRVELVVNIFRDITERKRQTDATAFLAAASTTLASTQEIAARLQQLSEMAVPRIADRFAIDLIDNQTRQLQRVASAYLDPDALEIASSAAPASQLSVPLIVRGQTIGTITMATTRSGRKYDGTDRELAADLANRVALAIDNARLLRESREQIEHQAMLNAALRSSIQERDRAVADLEHALRSRDEFLSSASHDLKSPLSSIKGTVQLLQRRLNQTGVIETDRLRDGLQRVDAIVTRAAGLVDELLDLTRMQMGQLLDLERRPTDLLALARDAANEHQQLSERHTIQVEADEPGPIGDWDPRRLSRVLSNLLNNAIKYSPEGGPVEVKVSRDADWAVVSVIDHGIGIRPSELERIFERFERGSNVGDRISGTGIGLASARHIVESHGGTISVESQEGSGSTFIVRLPLEPQT